MSDALDSMGRALDSAFSRALSAIDDAMQLVRAQRMATMPYRVETLSTSLSDPRAFQIELSLSNARLVIQTDADRAAFIAVARACEAQDLISNAAAERLVKDFQNA